MSTTEIVLVQDRIAKNKPAEERFEAWKTILNEIFKCETELLFKVDKFIQENPLDALPKPPFTQVQINMIPAIEEKIKFAKMNSKASNEARSVYTKKLQDFCKRMMAPEQAWDSIDAEYGKVLLGIKKFERDENEKIRIRQQELVDFRRRRVAAQNDEIQALENWIEDTCLEAYTQAIKSYPKVVAFSGEFDSIEYLIEFLKNEKGLGGFKIPIASWGADKEKQAIQDEIFAEFDPVFFHEKFCKRLEEVFENYEFAVSQKDAAIKEAEQQAAQKKEEVQENKELDNQMAEVISKVSVPVVTQGKKQLKKVYSINMEHTEETMFEIIRCFFEKKKELMKMYRGSDPWKISIEKMADLICEYKNKNEDYIPKGLSFDEKEII